MRRVLQALFAAGCLAAGAAGAAYPDRTITIVVPYAAGGGADPVARRLALGLSRKFATAVVVENRPGASGTIGAAQVAKAAADGYTLLLDATPFSINPHLYARLPYASRDFAPVSGVLLSPQLLVVLPDSPIRSVPDLVSRAQAQPGRSPTGPAAPERCSAWRQSCCGRG